MKFAWCLYVFVHSIVFATDCLLVPLAVVVTACYRNFLVNAVYIVFVYVFLFVFATALLCCFAKLKFMKVKENNLPGKTLHLP